MHRPRLKEFHPSQRIIVDKNTNPDVDENSISDVDTGFAKIGWGKRGGKPCLPGNFELGVCQVHIPQPVECNNTVIRSVMESSSITTEQPWSEWARTAPARLENEGRCPDSLGLAPMSEGVKHGARAETARSQPHTSDCGRLFLGRAYPAACTLIPSLLLRATQHDPGEGSSEGVEFLGKSLNNKLLPHPPKSPRLPTRGTEDATDEQRRAGEYQARSSGKADTVVAERSKVESAAQSPTAPRKALSSSTYPAPQHFKSLHSGLLNSSQRCGPPSPRDTSPSRPDTVGSQHNSDPLQEDPHCYTYTYADIQIPTIPQQARTPRTPRRPELPGYAVKRERQLNSPYHPNRLPIPADSWLQRTQGVSAVVQGCRDEPPAGADTPRVGCRKAPQPWAYTEHRLGSYTNWTCPWDIMSETPRPPPDCPPTAPDAQYLPTSRRIPKTEWVRGRSPYATAPGLEYSLDWLWHDEKTERGFHVMEPDKPGVSWDEVHMERSACEEQVAQGLPSQPRTADKLTRQSDAEVTNHLTTESLTSRSIIPARPPSTQNPNSSRKAVSPKRGKVFSDPAAMRSFRAQAIWNPQAFKFNTIHSNIGKPFPPTCLRERILSGDAPLGLQVVHNPRAQEA